MQTLRRTLIVICCGMFSVGWPDPAPAQPAPDLVAVASQGDWSTLRVLLDSSDVNVNDAYGDGSTALHWASYHDNTEIARLLLERGAAANTANDLGATPLWLAAENGSPAMTALLLQHGADPGSGLLTGETPLMTAALTGNAEVVELLLDAGANPNTAVVRQQTALMWAANQRHAGAVEALIRHGADVNAATAVRQSYVKTEKPQDSNPAYKIWVEDGGHTPLMFAARAGDLESARLLANAGARLDAHSAFGLTPAIMAVHGGNAGLLEYLLQQGADPNDNVSGHTALHAAVLRGDKAAVAVLLAHGADPNAVLQRATPVRRQSDDYHFHDAFVGATALWLAARFSEPDIMALLLDAGADGTVVTHVRYPAQRNLAENYMEDEGEISVLMAALGMGHRRATPSWGTAERRAGIIDKDPEVLILHAAQLAIAAGADINLRNSASQTALAYARARRYASVADLLVAAGASE